MFHCRGRLLELKSFLSLPSIMEGNISQDELNHTEFPVNFLKPFQVATKYKVTGSVWLESLLLAVVNQHGSSPFIHAVKGILPLRWVNNFIDTDVIRMCTALLPCVSPAIPLGALC